VTTIYIALWTHAQGQEVSAHTTEDGAYNQCADWAKLSLEKWVTPEQQHRYINMDKRALANNWSEVTDFDEFLRVEEVELNTDETGEIETSLFDPFEIPREDEN
jgi:hypothetical protein